jgi:drug/metabolite transporter (DMT)-like permease
VDEPAGPVRGDAATEPAAPTVGMRAAVAARSGLLTLARVVRLIAWGVVAVIVAGILLVVLGANSHNDIVSTIHDWGSTLVGPFKDLFSIKNHKTSIAVNWGIAAVVYLIAGSILARFIARMAAGPLRRAP